jgi:SAM-dependent methyltransferase
MGEPAGWQRHVEEFVLEQIGDPPTRMLEIGCGKGELALTLARAGHRVTAIDPRAPEGPIFRREGIEEFSDPGKFDHVVSSLALHHIEDLGMALGKMADLLRAGGTLVVVEFAWDRIDEATAKWTLDRLPASSPSEKPWWLEHCCRGWVQGGEGRSHDHGGHAEAHFAGWAGEERLHGSRRVRAELQRHFVERYLEWVPYLYADLGEGVSEVDERAAIEAGTINATGLRYVGTVALEEEHSGRTGRALAEPS